MALLSYPFFNSAADDLNLDLDTNPFHLLTTRRRRPETSRNLLRNFSPRFDVRESTDAYHLDGELPGIDQKDIEIEFSDPHTMVVKGHSTRTYEHSNDDADDDRASAAASPTRKATVEPADNDDDDAHNGAGSKVPSKRKSTANSRQYKYWVSERASGSFHRTFNFRSPVDEDAVKASLRNGVLAVHVPKRLAKKPHRRIRID